MDQVKDPVCGMMISRASAVGKAWHKGQEYNFCSDTCRRAFESEPQRYTDTERHEPPYTETKGFVAPKFGSAGSGGLENEPIPEMHDKK
ncbi:MAG: YHS domain-containing protein [Gemmatimonadota bacterium]